VLAYEITDTQAGDGETLPVVFKQAEANRPVGPNPTFVLPTAK
jgi:hypothetical protein